MADATKWKLPETCVKCGNNGELLDAHHRYQLGPTPDRVWDGPNYLEVFDSMIFRCTVCTYSVLRYPLDKCEVVTDFPHDQGDEHRE